MKRKFIIGVTLAVLLLVVGQYFLLPTRYRELVGVNAFGWLIMLSVGVGVASSVWLLNYVILKLLDSKPSLFGLNSSAPTGSRNGAWLVGVVSLPLGFFLGFTAGGILGGGTGEVIAGNAGIIIGIGLGVFAVMTIVTSAAALVGFVLGGFTEKLAKRLFA
jgi:hypothetical protein